MFRCCIEKEKDKFRDLKLVMETSHPTGTNQKNTRGFSVLVTNDKIFRNMFRYHNFSWNTTFLSWGVEFQFNNFFNKITVI